MRFISLTADEKKQLEELLRASSVEIIRRRSHCLLLSHKGITTVLLSQIFDVSLPTLYNWFNAWEQNKYDSLRYQPGQGRKAKLIRVDPAILQELIQAYPRSLDAIVRQLAKQYGITCHKDTLRRQLRRYAINLKNSQL